MTTKWEVITNPVTFQPALTLTLNGKRTNVAIPIEVVMDKPSENDFMLMILNQMEGLSLEETDEAYTALIARKNAPLVTTTQK